MIVIDSACMCMTIRLPLPTTNQRTTLTKKQAVEATPEKVASFVDVLLFCAFALALHRVESINPGPSSISPGSPKPCADVLVGNGV